MQLSRSEFLMQQQSDNGHSVSLNGQVNNSGEIKIIHCINTASRAVNRTRSHEKQSSLDPKGVGCVLWRGAQPFSPGRASTIAFVCASQQELLGF